MAACRVPDQRGAIDTFDALAISAIPRVPAT